MNSYRNNKTDTFDKYIEPIVKHKSNFHLISINGSNIGAFAVGGCGTSVSGSINDSKPATNDQEYEFKFNARNVTKRQLSRWLRAVVSILEDPDHLTTSHAANHPTTKASQAWSLKKEDEIA